LFDLGGLADADYAQKIDYLMGDLLVLIMPKK